MNTKNENNSFTKSSTQSPVTSLHEDEEDSTENQDEEEEENEDMEEPEENDLEEDLDIKEDLKEPSQRKTESIRPSLKLPKIKSKTNSKTNPMNQSFDPILSATLPTVLKNKERQTTPEPLSTDYNTTLCNDSMTFEECELAILRHYADKNEVIIQNKDVESNDLKQMISLIEGYLRKKKLVCYGGTAINNILPEEYQFYSEDFEIPDYDFYSPTPFVHAREIADIYANAGYTDVEAKAGVHPGTVKVFVQTIGIADITYLEKPVYDIVSRDAIVKDGIYYAPPDFLRMNMYIELSRPQGHVSRWEKVLKRLNLLNRFYPLEYHNNCINDDDEVKQIEARAFEIIRDSIIDNKGVFFGGYALSLYARYIPNSEKKLVNAAQSIDAFIEDMENVTAEIKQKLKQSGFASVEIKSNPPVEGLVNRSNEILVDGVSVVFLFEPDGCQNYNRVTIDNRNVRIATIDTILSYYLAFYYIDKPKYDKERVICMAQLLFDVQKDTKLVQKDILKRFSSSCIGKQKSLLDIRKKKSEKFREFKQKKVKSGEEYDMYFFKYEPGKVKSKTQQEKIAELSNPSVTKSVSPSKGLSKMETMKKTETKSISQESAYAEDEEEESIEPTSRSTQEMTNTLPSYTHPPVRKPKNTVRRPFRRVIKSTYNKQKKKVKRTKRFENLIQKKQTRRKGMDSPFRFPE